MQVLQTLKHVPMLKVHTLLIQLSFLCLTIYHLCSFTSSYILCSKIDEAASDLQLAYAIRGACDWFIFCIWRHGSDREGNKQISANNGLDQRQMFVVLTCTQRFLVNSLLFCWQIDKVGSQDKFIFLPVFTLDLSIPDKSTVTIYIRRWTWSSILLLNTNYIPYKTKLYWWIKPLTELHTV